MFRRFLIVLLSVAFLGAGVIAAGPALMRDGTSYLTQGLSSTSPGVFAVVERPELRPQTPDTTVYQSPRIEGAERQVTLAPILPRRWHLFAPTADPATPNPVVILFHGAGRDSLSMIDQWQTTAEAEGLVLIGLNAPPGGWPVDNPNGAFLTDVLTQAEQSVPIDRDRVFLYGYSAGSIMAQVVANRVVGPWRGVATHAGTVNPGFLHRITDAPPVRHYLGTSDAIFDPATARRAGELTAEAGHDHTLILIPGHTHWYYVGGPAFAADAWAWFDSL